MRFEWDEGKNRANLQKHGASFELAAEVFHDPLCLTLEGQTVEGEERLWTIGCIENLVTLVVAHTTFDDSEGDEVVRIISARKATPRERYFYEKQTR